MLSLSALGNSVSHCRVMVITGPFLMAPMRVVIQNKRRNLERNLDKSVTRMILEKFLDDEKITFSTMSFLIYIPNLGFRTYMQHSALIPSVADLHLKIGKIPVYSASPWIESLAHTVYDEYLNIVSIYYMNDPEFTNIHYNLHSSRLAFYKD